MQKANTHHKSRFLHCCIAAAACSMIASCSSAEGDRTTGAEPLATTHAPVSVNCAAVVGGATPDIMKLVAVAKDVVAIYSSSGVAAAAGAGADAIANAFAFMNTGPSVEQKIEALKAELDCVAQGLDWKMGELDFNTNQWAPVSAAWAEAQEVGFARGSAYDATSHDAVVAAGGLVMFERFFVEASTDGSWKNIITNHEPAILDVQQVFDWRLALPWFTQLVAMRLTMIAKMDNQFAADGTWNAELDGSDAVPGYRRVLQSRLQQMLAGVRCDNKNRIVAHNWTAPGGNGLYQGLKYDHTDIACADVNTGINATSTYVIPSYDSCRRTVRGVPPHDYYDAKCVANLPGNATVASLQDGLRRQVLSQMPIFQVQSLIDSLYRYTHPETYDLAGLWEQITSEPATNLCLDVVNGNSASGTPVQIYPCLFNDAQWWQYDRKTGMIFNPAFGKCLEVQPVVLTLPLIGTITIDQRTAGVPVQIDDCAVASPSPTSPLPARQQWTYDPESKVLQNGDNTVLDLQGGSIQAGTPVLTGDRSGASSQQWHADQQLGFQASPPTGCGTMTVDQGLYVGQQVTSCDGRFMWRFESDGNLVLYQISPYNPPGLPPGTMTTWIWSTDTSGLVANMLIMQGDGNLVLYNMMGAPIWSTGTVGYPGSYFAIQNDGNLGVYDATGQPRWASNTCCH